MLLDPRFENPYQQKIWDRAEGKPSVAACPITLRRLAGSIADIRRNGCAKKCQEDVTFSHVLEQWHGGHTTQFATI